MKPELEKILVEKYPKLFRDYKGCPTKTCMCWGIETNDGWFNLLDHLFGYLTNLMETKLHVDYTEQYRNQHENDKDYYHAFYSYKLIPPRIILDQVKEKYGTLRVYYHTEVENEIPQNVLANLDENDYHEKLERYNEKIDFAIDYAEYQSSVTCEVTGKEGKLYTQGWCVTLCDEEAKKRNKDPKDASSLKKIEY